MAARPPAQFVAPTLGRSGGGGFPGSRTTSGMSASRSCSSWPAGELGGHQDHPVGIVARQPARPARRPGIAVPYRGDRHGGGVLGAPLLHAAQDLHRPRAVQAVEHQVDEAGPAMPPGARPGVLVLVEQSLDKRARRRGDIPPSVHHLRDRRQRHAGLGGDSRQGRPPAIPPSGLADRIAAWKHCTTFSHRRLIAGPVGPHGDRQHPKNFRSRYRDFGRERHYPGIA